MERRMWVVWSVLALTVGAIGGASPAKAGAGTDTGNGGGGYGGSIAIPRYDRIAVSTWCNEVQGWMADAIRTANFLRSPAKQRHYLRGAITAILDAYDVNNLPFQPLTYSLLARSLELENVFTSCSEQCDEYSLANRSATLVLVHMLNLGMKVNSEFDQPQYIPYFENRQGCRTCPEYEFSSFRVDYLSNVRAVLSTFFSPAFEKSSHGSLLDALGTDTWELRTQYVILDWAISDIGNDVFRRSFDCVVGRLNLVRIKLRDHLEGRPMFSDAEMVQYVRGSLADVLGLLDHREFDDRGRYLCRHRPIR